MCKHIGPEASPFMRNRIQLPNSLAGMATGERNYDEKCAEHARQVLARFVQQCGSQEAAGRALGIDQSAVNRVLVGKQQAQLKMLIPLAGRLGWTLDQVLGLAEPPSSKLLAPPSEQTFRLSESQLSRVAEKVAEHVTRRITPGPMPAVKLPKKPGSDR